VISEMEYIIFENTDIKIFSSNVLNGYSCDVHLLIKRKSTCRLVKLICNFVLTWHVRKEKELKHKIF
jgi:hypothetical protein